MFEVIPANPHRDCCDFCNILFGGDSQRIRTFIGVIFGLSPWFLGHTVDFV